MSQTSSTERGAAGGRTLSAIFDNRADAVAAAERLVAAGLARADVRVIPEGPDTADVGTEGGFLGALASVFFPREEEGAYAEAVRRGGVLVVAERVPPALHDAALDALDQTGAFDPDERAAAWRSEGWAEPGAPDAVDAPAAPRARRDPGPGRGSVRSYTEG